MDVLLKVEADLKSSLATVQKRIQELKDAIHPGDTPEKRQAAARLLYERLFQLSEIDERYSGHFNLLATVREYLTDNPCSEAKWIQLPSRFIDTAIILWLAKWNYRIDLIELGGSKERRLYLTND